MTTHRLTTLAMLAALLAVSGCRDREIQSYRAPKDPASTLSAAKPAGGELPPDHPPIGGNMDMANTPVPTGSDSLTWTAPAHWTAKPAGAMRKGSFAIKNDNGQEADLSITAFPGDTGGLHANLNRWRGQVGLAPAAPAELDAAIQHMDGQNLHFDVVDFLGTGTPSTRILGAVLNRPGETWFFKLMGPSDLVGTQKAAFLEFLHTVKDQNK